MFLFDVEYEGAVGFGFSSLSPGNEDSSLASCPSTSEQGACTSWPAP